MLIRNDIIGLDVPQWLVDQFYYKWGFHVDNKVIKNLSKEPKQDLSDRHFLMYDIQLGNAFKDKSLWQEFLGYIKKSQVHSIVFYIRDMFYVTPELLKELNILAINKKFHIITNCYDKFDYQNLNFHVFNEEEVLSSHPIIQSLSLEYATNKKDSRKDFLLTTVLKDSFRKTVYEHLVASGVLHNSVVKTHARSDEVPNLDSLVTELEQITRNKHFVSAIKYIGHAPPIFWAYEEVFCEIVMESKNLGVSDLSEKTFRPIYLGVPIVFLGSEIMYKKLINDGYELVDNNEFYKCWHGLGNFNDKLNALVKFLQDIVNDRVLRGKMKTSAEHNFNVFWIERPMKNKKNELEIIHKIFGDNNLITQIYKRLNF